MNKPVLKTTGLVRSFALFAALLAAAVMPQQAKAVSPDIVIVEVYGGGGNSGSTYKNDFIGLYNRGGAAVNITGWSVQYASSAGSSWAKTDLTGTIPAGGYYLVQESAGGGGTVSLPTPDATGTLTMAVGAGKVALVSNGTLLTVSNPAPSLVVDFVGYGSAANFYEGTGPTATITASLSAQRAGGGCTDTDNNASDFTTAAPNPRNSGATVSPCGGGAGPSITGQSGDQTAYVGGTVAFSVSASGSPTLTYFWYKDNVLLNNDSQTSGATTSSLTVSNLTAGNAGSYVLVITNSFGSITSAPAVLTVSDSGPIFVSQPQSRSSLVGTPASFSVSVQGSAPLSYRWKKDGVNLVDNGRIVGSATSSLTITNVTAGDAGDYTVGVTNGISGDVSSPATLSVSSSGILAGWNFNGPLNTNSPVPSSGSSAAVASAIIAVPFANPFGSASDFGSLNYGWGTAPYPAAAVSNKQAGVQFKVSTVGFKNLALAFERRESTTASRYVRPQFTTNGTTYIDFPLSSDININNATSGNTNYKSFSFSLTGFPGVENNPNFGVRIVSEFESTAKYGATTNANYVANIPTSTYSTSGTITYDSFNITADASTDSNNQPTISALTNQTTLDTVPVIVNLTIGDVETAAGSLGVSATSANSSVLSDGQIVPGGSGASRTLTITPTPGSTGVVPIIVTVTDGNGATVKGWFYLTINPGNFAPTISTIPHTNTVGVTPLTIPITIGDDHTAAASLTLSEASFNTTLIPDSNIQFGGSGSNRTVTIIPAANQFGVAPITITLSDNDPANPLTSTTSFTVMVRPNTNIVINDFFDYADGSITEQSFGLYQQTSAGSSGKVMVTGGELIADNVASEDVNIPLLGQRFSTNSNVALYSSFKVRFTSLPTTTGGSYFAHFKDDNSGAATGFGARVWASTLNASNGLFRLGIGNGANATNTSGQFPLDLSIGTTYTVVTKFVPTNGLATIWVNPTSETDLNVTANDVGSAARPNPIDVIAYGIRQAGGTTTAGEEGAKAIDNLKVGLSFAAVTGIPTLNYQSAGGKIVFSWSDPSFALQTAPDVTGAYTNISGATSPFTNATSNARQFFRLQK